MADKKVVVTIDDNAANIQIIVSALRAYYTIIAFTEAKEALAYFKLKRRCDLILLDIEMPEISGFEFIKLLKADANTSHIPVIFLTGRANVQNEIEGLDLGAADYIYKPINPPLVKKRIDVQLALDDYSNRLEDMVKAKTATIEKLSDVTISTIISIIGTRDEETRGHILRTSEYVVALASELAKNKKYAAVLTPERITELRKAAPLHDVGKVGIVDAILKKPDRLTNPEFDTMKMHTVIGGAAFKKATVLMGEPSFLELAMVLAWCHHEKWDGSGYPRGIKGEKIPLEARIMAIADVYDALISHRPYKKPMLHSEAVSIIMKGKGSHFDPTLCDAFKNVNLAFDEIAQRLGTEFDMPEMFEI